MVLHLEYYSLVQAGCKLLGLKYSPRNVSFFSLKKIIYLSAVLGLCRCPGFSLVVASEGYSPAVSSLTVEHRFQGARTSVVVAPGFQSTGSIVVVPRPICSVACGIFPEQGSNSCLQHWQVDSLSLSCQESPEFLFWILFYVDINEDVIK